MMIEQNAILAFLVALLIATLFAVNKNRIQSLTKRRHDDADATQATHSGYTPRLGGVPIALGMASTVFVIPLAASSELIMLLASASIVFLAGFSEDLGFRVSPSGRLIAAAISAVTAIYFFEAWIDEIEFFGMNLLLGSSALGIGFTILGIAGVSHAFNLIDGVNGLAASVGIAICLGLVSISSLAGIETIAVIASVLAAAILGFMILNYPFGKLFLGDAGAYGIGFCLAWLSVFLCSQAPAVSPWAILLIFFWPIADTLFAILRRRRAGKPADQPDRMHFHHLAMRFTEIALLGRSRRHLANPIATLVILPFSVAPVILGVLLWDNGKAAFFAVFGLACLFVATYQYFIWLTRRLRRSRRPHDIENTNVLPAE